MDSILGFSGPYRFMSNFVPVQVELDGVTYRSVEHAYQAAKTLSAAERDLVRQAPTAAKAKALGQKVTKRPDWEEIKIGVMRELLIQKFAQPSFAQQLLATKAAYLEETNTWNDTFWGVYGGRGRNVLGQLLMELRENLQKVLGC